MPRIDRIDTAIVDLPTIRPHVLSMATLRMQSAVIVQIRFADGSVGIGEGAVIGGLRYGPESVEGVKLTIDSHLAPALAGREGDEISSARAALDAVARGNQIAKAALETALWDGLGRRLGTPVSTFFGGRVRPALPVAWTLASGVSEVDIAEAEEMLATGRHRVFKLKIGARPVREDVAHVAQIARMVGDRARITVDVNQAWRMDEARWGVAALAEAGCALIEQPIAARDLAGMAELRRTGPAAVMADEALAGPADALAVVAARAADAFSIKIGPTGGLAPAAEVAAMGAAAEIGLYGGTLLETGVGTAAAAQLFATLPRLDWGTELFGPLLFTESLLTEELLYRDGMLEAPTGPGLGVDLDLDKLAALRRDRTRTVAGAVS